VRAPAIAPSSSSTAVNEVIVQAGESGIRCLLVSGKPLQESVAWYDPIVMKSQAELNQALRELQDMTFIKKGAQGGSPWQGIGSATKIASRRPRSIGGPFGS
jgi:hypothetical protein